MGDGRIFLKTRRDVSFNKVLSNEPTSAGSISLDSTFKTVPSFDWKLRKRLAGTWQAKAFCKDCTEQKEKIMNISNISKCINI